MLEFIEHLFVSPKKSENRVLVIDDNQESCYLLSKLLEKQHVPYEILRRPQQVYWEVYSNHYDLILLDIMMPKISGYKLLQDIRKDFSMLELPIIMVSAKSQNEDIERALEFGANDFIKKPIQFDTAWNKIHFYLNSKNLGNAVS